MAENKSIAHGWLTDFYQGEVSPESQMAIWTMKNKKHHWCASIEEAVAVAEKQKGNTYFTMGLYPISNTQRKQDHVKCIFGVWLDIDVGDKGKGAKYFPDMETAVSWIQDSLAGMWTYVVHSGGGLHVYLMFDEPFWINNDDDRLVARKIIRYYWAWANTQTEYTIDALTDLSRIMRLPGTRHTGKGETCHVIDQCDTRVSALELMEKLPSAPLPAESGQVAGLDGEADPETVKRKLALIQDADIQFLKTWKRTRRLKDQTPSAYCLSIANQLCVAGFNDSEIQCALEMWRASQTDAGPKQPEWYHATIKKARAASNATETEKQFDNQLSLAVLETDEANQAETTTVVFGAALGSIIKHSTKEHRGHKEKVQYTLKFVGGKSIAVPSSSALMNQGAMRELLYEELGFVMKRLKAPQWDKVLKLLQGMMQEEEAAVEGNLAYNIEEELQLFVGQKIENAEVTRDLAEWGRQMLYQDDTEQYYFNWTAFKIRLGNTGVNVSNKQMAKILTALGSESVQFGDIRRTRMWRVPDAV